MTTSQYLPLAQGQLAYTVEGVGEGPLVVCVPGMGDLAGSYRFTTPALVTAGFRVATMDLRGHGASDATFSEYGAEATAGDIAALMDALGGGPATVIGNSLGASAGALLAATRPELVSGLVLIGPFVRPPAMSALTRLATRVAMLPPLAALSWKAYLPKLYAGRQPSDIVTYRAEVHAALKRPGHAKAFSLTARETHRAAAAGLASVKTPTLIVMGALDPDFPDPAAEAAWIAAALTGAQTTEVLNVPDSGHYPQSQQPDLVNDALIAFGRATHA